MGAVAPEVALGELYVGYAADPDIRSVASSGGVVSGVLTHLLERHLIDAALVSRITSVDGRVCGVTELARTKQQVLDHAGSSYIDTPVVNRVKALRDIPGKVAVVALPCQARLLKRLLARDGALRQKVALVIGLFCRGTVTRQFYEDIFGRYGIDQAAVESVKVDRGHLKGMVYVRLRDQQERAIPFATLNAYRMAGVHAKRYCLWCDEHLSEQADLSVGDIFTKEFKRRPIKHSAFICRSETAADVVAQMQCDGLLELELFGIDRYRRTFSRLERYSNDLRPRRVAARLTGFKPVGPPSWRVNPAHCLAWTLFMLNRRLTGSDAGRRLVYGLPSSLISLVSLSIKALSRI